MKKRIIKKYSKPFNVDACAHGEYVGYLIEEYDYFCKKFKRPCYIFTSRNKCYTVPIGVLRKTKKDRQELKRKQRRWKMELQEFRNSREHYEHFKNSEELKLIF